MDEIIASREAELRPIDLIRWVSDDEPTDYDFLFDPSTCPELHKQAFLCYRVLREGVMSGRATITDEHDISCDVDDPDVYVFLCTDSWDILAVRDPNALKDAYAAANRQHLRKATFRNCQMGLAPECAGDDMEIWPWLCGKWLFLFMVCPACRAEARRMTEDGRELGEIAAHEAAPHAAQRAFVRRWWQSVLKRAGQG
jgi:hypothetical protein